MSPTIFAVPFAEPSQRPDWGAAGGGTISATGSPKRVTRIGWPVLRTRSSTARHVALNFEMAIRSILFAYHTMVDDHGPNYGSAISARATLFPASCLD